MGPKFVTARLAGYLDENENSFNLVRLAAAFSVIASHSVLIRFGTSHAEPLAVLTPYTLGQHAVNAFFVISGLTLSQSLTRNPDLVQYGWARFLRIFPGLFFYGVVFAFLIGPLVTTVSLRDYFADVHTLLYPIATLVGFQNAAPPPGLFAGHPAGSAINEPLWTIKYELVAYLGLAILALLGLTKRIGTVLSFLAASAGVFFLVEAFIAKPDGLATWMHHLTRYGVCFMLGVAAFHLRRHIVVAPVLLIATGVLVAVLRGTSLEELACFLFVAHFVLVMGARAYGPLTRWTRKTDVSYGTYIYGWPVQQSLLALFPTVTVSGLAVSSIAIAAMLGFVSWRLVELPALRLKRLRISEIFIRPKPV